MTPAERDALVIVGGFVVATLLLFVIGAIFLGVALRSLAARSASSQLPAFLANVEALRLQSQRLDARLSEADLVVARIGGAIGRIGDAVASVRSGARELTAAAGLLIGSVRALVGLVHR
ncbi:MAG: hypothetical protein ACREM8_13560 [Vulcanimicrobiaceae bacterium]